jgi:hypothetical protein
VPARSTGRREAGLWCVCPGRKRKSIPGGVVLMLPSAIRRFLRESAPRHCKSSQHSSLQGMAREAQLMRSLTSFLF